MCSGKGSLLEDNTTTGRRHFRECLYTAPESRRAAPFDLRVFSLHAAHGSLKFRQYRLSVEPEDFTAPHDVLRIFNAPLSFGKGAIVKGCTPAEPVWIASVDVVVVQPLALVHQYLGGAACLWQLGQQHRHRMSPAAPPSLR